MDLIEDDESGKMSDKSYRGRSPIIWYNISQSEGKFWVSTEEKSESHF